MTAIPSTVAATSIADGAAIVAADHRNNYSAMQTAINGLIAALSSGSAGQVLKALSSSSVDWSGGTYAAYTPTWAASGTAVAIGNATVIGQYTQMGKMVHAYGLIQFGNSSTYGTGSYTVALPVACTANATLLGTSYLFDNSASSMFQAIVTVSSTTLMRVTYGATYGGTLTQAGQLAPWTWAQNDFIAWNITYEAA